MSWTFEKVAGPFGFTEGPAWDGECLLFTDIPNNRIMRYDPRPDIALNFARAPTKATV